MARGANAKAAVENKIAAAFGEDYIGMYDKKLYVWADDGGERVQIAISMTCPKTKFSVEGDSFPEGNFGTPDTYVPAEMTENEMDNVRRLIQELGW